MEMNLSKKNRCVTIEIERTKIEQLMNDKIVIDCWTTFKGDFASNIFGIFLQIICQEIHVTIEGETNICSSILVKDYTRRLRKYKTVNKIWLNQMLKY